MNNIQKLGASLYVPANHKDLSGIANGLLLSYLRSVIFCTEDAVAESDLSYSLSNLELTLKHMTVRPCTQRFVRVRNPEVMNRVLTMRGSDKLTGFVLPKVTRHNFDAYFRQIRNSQHLLMPTLETVEAFDEIELKQLRLCLEKPGVRNHILALRIGGNDLFALLGMRRPRNMTIYRTPLGPVIAKIVTTFRPYGFHLTAPVFEYMDREKLLDEEIREDLAHGMIGKTAIHPSQVAVIERHYMVDPHDIEVARCIMDAACPAVFRMHDSMCELATHLAWARCVMEQAKIFGIHYSNDNNGVLPN